MSRAILRIPHPKGFWLTAPGLWLRRSAFQGRKETVGCLEVVEHEPVVIRYFRAELKPDMRHFLFQELIEQIVQLYLVFTLGFEMHLLCVCVCVCVRVCLCLCVGVLCSDRYPGWSCGHSGVL